MKITILTLFPEMFSALDHSIIKRAKEKGLVEIELINIRDFGIGKHQLTDDTPYGGGIGMVMRVDVLHKAIEHAKQSVILERSANAAIESPARDPISLRQYGGSFQDDERINQKVILLSAGGKTFNQTKAREFTTLDHLILVCGHYEGVDERIMPYIDEELSIGDFVLTGGELPAMVITDAVTRLIKGVITEGATDDESFSHPEKAGNEEFTALLEYPHYTRPQEYNGMTVPEILRSGDHKKVDAWRREKAREKTKKIRPDLLKK